MHLYGGSLFPMLGVEKRLERGQAQRDNHMRSQEGQEDKAAYKPRWEDVGENTSAHTLTSNFLPPGQWQKKCL